MHVHVCVHVYMYVLLRMFMRVCAFVVYAVNISVCRVLNRIHTLFGHNIRMYVNIIHTGRTRYSIRTALDPSLTTLSLSPK